MQKTIQPVNITASEELLSSINEIFDKLDKYHDRIVSADIYLKEHNERDVNQKEMEIRLFMPGKDLFMVHAAESFISAAQQLFDKVKVQLSKEKEREKDNRKPRLDKMV